MRAPRRTPYERPGALDHLYGLLYPDHQCSIIDEERYRQQRNEGLAIVHLWLNRSACPHAVESTCSLIHAQNLDEKLNFQHLLAPSIGASDWVVRCSYSTAILRFVNSVVDTFQTSMYAKSIFQISQSIGLPAYLVELRHAATHEELPSITVLRDACRESLLWLQKNFWWPTLAKQAMQEGTSIDPVRSISSTSSLMAVDRSTLQQEAIIQLRLHLARYRRLAKRVVKDESLRGRYKTALSSAQSKLESCAKKYQADFIQNRLLAGREEENWEEDQLDGTAASLLVDVLLEAGGIVPLSKRKRPRSSEDQGEIIARMPTQLYQTWLPLLNHLSASVESFSDALQEGLVSCLTLQSSTLGKSYMDTIASWTITLFGDDTAVLAAPKSTNRQQLYSDMSEEDGTSEQDKPTLMLVRKCLSVPTAMSLTVARLLCEKDERLAERVKPLFDMVESSSIEGGSSTQQAQAREVMATLSDVKDAPASDLELSVLEMERRLQALEDTPVINQSTSNSQTIEKVKKPREEQVNVCKQLQGWQMAPEDWKPTPIGCLDGIVPHLILP